MNPPKVKAGDSLTAAGWNSLVTGIINANGIIGSGNGQVSKETPGGRYTANSQSIPIHYIGTITTTGEDGEDNYDDERYFVALSYVSNDGGDKTAAATVEKYDDGIFKRTITVTNIQEISYGTHLLAADSPVVVYAELDRGSPAVLRYYIDVAIPLQYVADISQVSGSAGDGTTACSFTYDVKGPDGTTTVLTATSPDRPRPIGKMTAATQGYCYVDDEGIHLAEAWEKPATNHC